MSNDFDTDDIKILEDLVHRCFALQRLIPFDKSADSLLQNNLRIVRTYYGEKIYRQLKASLKADRNYSPIRKAN